jgi:hypothetical protein
MAHVGHSMAYAMQAQKAKHSRVLMCEDSGDYVGDILDPGSCHP